MWYFVCHVILIFVCYKHGNKQIDFIRKVSEILGIPPTTISSVKKRIEEWGSVENIRRSGQPPKVSDRHYRRLERLVKTNKRESLIEITNKCYENIDQPVAKHTVQLHKHGFLRRVSTKKVVVKESNRKKWLAWSRGKRQMTVQNYWNKVIFQMNPK